MTRQEIEVQLQKNDSTILSFPERGPWGDKMYRGNCSGWIHAFLIWKYNVNKMAELFSGSGTGYDVAKDMGISYVGADLNPTPVRPGIIQCDAFGDEVPEAFLDADMLFMHPPYGAEIKIPYAGYMWKDATGDLARSDLGQMPWDKFMKTLNSIIMKYYSAMQSGSRMAILMGDVRRNGLHSMLLDIVRPGILDQVIIKAQHNCSSNSRLYMEKNFVPIVHEYIMVLKKLAPYILDFQLPQKHELDIRDSSSATWRDVVYATLQKIGRSATLAEIYKEIDGHRKCKNNVNWQAKIRQTLQQGERFVHIGQGTWALKAA